MQYKGTAKLLRQARALIENPENWGKNHLHVFDAQRGAYRYCAVGAIERAARDRSMSVFTEDAEEAVRLLAGCIMPSLDPYHTITSFNDSPHTLHKDVLEKFDCALKGALADE